MEKKERNATIEVNFFGYSMELEVDPQKGELYYASLSTYVSNKMKEIAEITGSVEIPKIAILAALNFADELLTNDENLKKINAEIDNLIHSIDEVIEKT
jgi:cell division protein ZapA (FtsZ GTPase activity inhibitor)